MERKQDVVWAKYGELHFAKSNEQVTEYLAASRYNDNKISFPCSSTQQLVLHKI